MNFLDVSIWDRSIDRSLKRTTQRSYSFSWSAKKLTDLLIQLNHFGTHYIQSGLGSWGGALVFSFWTLKRVLNWKLVPIHPLGLSFRNRRQPFHRWPFEFGASKSQPGLELVSAKVNLYILEGNEAFTVINY